MKIDIPKYLILAIGNCTQHTWIFFFFFFNDPPQPAPQIKWQFLDPPQPAPRVTRGVRGLWDDPRITSARYEHSIFSALVWLVSGTEAKLERVSETSPFWWGHKDVLHLNKRNPFQEKRDFEAAVVNGVANPSHVPALNIFNALIWKN